MTSYIVLRRQDKLNGEVSEYWEAGVTVEAASAEAAIRAGTAGKEGTYVAVSERSWTPVKAKVETVTRVKLETA